MTKCRAGFATGTSPSEFQHITESLKQIDAYKIYKLLASVKTTLCSKHSTLKIIAPTITTYDYVVMSSDDKTLDLTNDN